MTVMVHGSMDLFPIHFVTITHNGDKLENHVDSYQCIAIMYKTINSYIDMILIWIVKLKTGTY